MESAGSVTSKTVWYRTTRSSVGVILMRPETEVTVRSAGVAVAAREVSMRKCPCCAQEKS